MIKSLGLMKALEEKKRGNSAVTYKPVPKDWAEFAKLTKIRSGKGYKPFVPYDYQVQLEKEIHQQVSTVAVKSRQMGITEVLVSILIHQCLLTPGCTCLFVSLTQPASSLVAKRARLVIESLGEYTSLMTDAVSTLTFHNGSTIHFRGSGLDSGRGIDSVSYLVFDEIAFQPRAGDLIAALAPSQSMLGKDARMILLSTPAGQEGAFYQRLVANNEIDLLQTIEGIRDGSEPPTLFYRDTTNVLKVVLSWRAHPIYSQDVNYLETIARRYNLPVELVEREYNLSFTHSDVSVFSPRLIQDNFTLTLTRQIEYGTKEYYSCVDPSGLGKDYCVALIFSIDKEGCIEIVDYYRAKSKPTSIDVNAIWKLCDKYRVDVGVCEENGLGSIVRQELNKSYYSFEPVLTGQGTKEARIQALLVLLENGRIKFPDNEKFRSEFLSFSRIGNRLEAATGATDDIVMCASFIPYLIFTVLGEFHKFNPIQPKENLQKRRSKFNLY